MKLDRFIKKRDLVELTTQLIQIPTENPPGNERKAFIFGPGGVDQSHTTDESVEVDALVQAAKIYALIVTHFLSLS